MKFIDKIFTNRYVFGVSTVLSAIGFLTNSVVLMGYNHNNNIFGEYSTLMLALCMIAFLICTVKHKDNAVKGIIGIIFGMAFLYDLRFFSKNCLSNPVKNNVLFIIKLAVDVILVVFYIISRENHTGGSKIIRVCQISFVVLAVVSVLNNLPYFIADFPDPDHRWIIQDFGETIGFVLMYFSTVCAACAVNKYKELHKQYEEKGEWTEEKRQKTKKELFGK